ncbi:MAG: hypothetical protein M0R28_17735 [Pigmentiphaga sp.]|nr:hypothetical protein [Pigmentiphaga sp.]
MATIRQLLDAGFTVDPDDAQEQDKAILWARAFYRSLGQDVPTMLGTALALEPAIVELDVAANTAKLDERASVLLVEATAGDTTGVLTRSLVATGPGFVKVSFVGNETVLQFDATDAVTKCSVMVLRAPADLLAVLAEQLE